MRGMLVSFALLTLGVSCGASPSASTETAPTVTAPAANGAPPQPAPESLAELTTTCDVHITTMASYGEGARGARGLPVDLVRGDLERRDVLKPGDVVERFEDLSDRGVAKVRLVRGGETVAIYTLFDDEHGGWLIPTVEACSGIGLG